MRISNVSRRTPLAAAVLASLQTTSMHALSAETAKPQQLPKISVGAAAAEEEAATSYKADVVSSPKYSEPLIDIPQNIMVVTRQVIDDQKLLSLRDVLSTVPGITFGAGEGGGGYGDSLTLRGFAGSNDITTDGIRDSAQYTRSDTFNLEQVEVINGANSVYSGAGAVGGTVNLVNKTPTLNPFNQVGAAAGTDSYGRITGDVNQTIGESTAVRLNVMAHQNDVPGRDVEENRRWGAAPSIAFGLGTDTSLSLAYLHQEDENTPQYGVPTFRGHTMPGAKYSNYYGYSNIDTQEIDVDSFTAVLDHRFDNTFSVRNLTRWAEVDQMAIVDPPQGTFCLASATAPSGAACAAGLPPGSYQPSGPRGNVRDTTNTLIVNQTDFTKTFSTGSVAHTLVAGFAISHETYDLDTGNVLRNPGGATPNPVLPLMSIENPDHLYGGPRNYVRSQTQDGELDNQAIYVFDTLGFSDHWELNGGVRYENNDGNTTTVAYATDGVRTASPPAENADKLFSYRVGLVYKPVETGSIYVAYGNSETPSKASVNGSCQLIQSPSNVGQLQGNANCTTDPEEAVNYELGIKWELFEARLLATASIFRNERTNYRVNDPGNPGNPSGQQQLDGEARVDGFIVGFAGKINDKWAAVLNYTYLDSEVLQGASAFASSRGEDYTRGDPLTNVPRNALSLWTAYDLPYRIQVGYGLTYQDEVYVTQHSSTNVNGPLYTAPGYIVHRAMVSWGVTRNLDLQLNANNLFDKEYLVRVRTQEQAWATPGEARSFVLAANYSF
ncbi:TonB-dependent siderophore receptor [Povalibacter sp.]|uniref:TonB-dependent receptor n=1 Tax=Povalibacter sp. TaxID=1962978 RepID=UPI002F405B43